jgi:hypothetical protein
MGQKKQVVVCGRLYVEKVIGGGVAAGLVYV